MARTIVGILRGGPSSEYELSLKTGAAFLNALQEDRYDTRDILIDRTGMWHLRGMPADPARILTQIDVVLNALHGGVGEDGTVQRILERAAVPYSGSNALSAALSLNKVRARELLRAADIRMPHAVSFALPIDLTTAEMAEAVFREFGPPYVLKPVNEGSSFGILIADSILDLPEMLGDVLDMHGSALVEEFIRGEEANVGVIENFRGEELYTLPPAHVQIPQGARFLDRDALAKGDIRYVVPSPFAHSEKSAIAEAAKAAHTALGLSHYSNSDIILTKRGPYLLEVNSVPHVHEHAAFPHMLESVGSSVRELAEHLIELARRV